MMKWLLAALLIALFPVAASAQTTTFSTGATCPASVSITSGTSLTFTTGDKITCLASTGKADGAWYFTVVESSPGHSNSVGVAGSTMPTDGTVEALGNGADGIAYWLYEDGGARSYVNGGLTPTQSPTITYTPGATMGVAINMSGAFQYFWVTPDINGTGGCGGGPTWNGSATSSPVVRGGCGGTSTGMQFTMGMNPVYPAIAGQNFSDQTVASFNFGSNGTMDSLLGGGGFQAWNVVGGQTANRPLVKQNIANAPLWQQSHGYVAGDRVIAGPGMAGGALTSGSPVYLWAVQGSGGTSSGSGNGPQSCPSPTNYGSGFNGTGTQAQWSGHTTANDNGITWVCLSPVDYVTVHDALHDAPPWQAFHQYGKTEWIVVNGYAFEAWPVDGTAWLCTSAGTPPPPGGGVDGTCNWISYGTVTYSSQSNYILHASSPINKWVMGITNTATQVVWYGGHSKQTYTNGTSGEDHPIDPTLSLLETDAIGGEVDTYCADRITNAFLGFTCGFVTSIVMTTAPGDSAGETLGKTGGPFRPDSNNGVMFTSSGSPTDGSNVAIYARATGGIIWNGIQLYNPDNVALGAETDIPNSGTGSAGVELTNMIVQGAGYAAVATFGGDILNSLVIYTGTPNYGSAWSGRFSGSLYNSILYGPGASACPLCIGRQLEKPEYPTNAGVPYGNNPILSNFQNTFLGGFADPLFYLTYSSDGHVPKFGPVTGTNNATDTPSGYVPKNYPIPPGGGTYFNAYDGGDTFQWPGTSGNGCNGGPCQGLDPAAQFVSVNPSSFDFRLKSTSVLHCAGAGPAVFPPLGWTSTIPTTDIAGNARPTSGCYDIGPMQYNGTLASPTITSPTTATGVVGTAFTYNIGATGGPTSYGASGLPSWASVNTGTGAITGTPDAAATTNATISATNSSGTGSGPLAIIISPALTTPSITSSLSLGCTVSVFCTYQITATQSPTSYGASGLPSGLSVNTGTGVISGTPSAPGVTSGPISATNTAGTGSATLTITVSGSVAAVPGGSLRMFH